MNLMRRLEPRKFNYKPRYYRPKTTEDDKRVKFRRTTYYDPGRHFRRPYILVALLILVAAMIYLLGGIRRSVTTITLNPDDVVMSAGN